MTLELAVSVQAVFCADFLPKVITDLIAALPDLNADDLPHSMRAKQREIHKK